MHALDPRDTCQALQARAACVVVIAQRCRASAALSVIEAGAGWTQRINRIGKRPGSDPLALQTSQKHEGTVEELDALLAAAQQLASEGETLPVRLERECRQLRDAATLYCLCRLPYDQDRPMLACDYCSNWFHYDCVGLDPPGAHYQSGAEAIA